MKRNLLSIYEYWLDWKLGAKITSALFSVTLLSVLVLMATSYWINTEEVTENTGSQWLILGDQVLERAAEKVTQEVRVLGTLSKTPSIIAAVKEANQDRADWTPEEILQLDQAWINHDSAADLLVNEVAENQISEYLVDFQKQNPAEVEIFITDLRGLNMAMTSQTSDFRQADEDWWYSAFAEGRGSTYIGAVEYDESSESFAMDIGIPIQDPDTRQTIGILRGTADISIMIHALKDVKLGTTGNVVLIDQNGIVLYSHDPAHFLKPVPESVLTLFQSGQRNWLQGTDLDGNAAIVAYSSLDPEAANSLGWRILFTQTLVESNQAHLRNILLSFLVSVLVIVIGTVISGIVIRHSMVLPLARITGLAHEISVGNVLQENDSSGLSLRKDEMGEISRAFDRLTAYFMAVAASATSIANKDLTINVESNSERDVLGIAFVRMVSELNGMIGQVSQNAMSVSLAAAQLAAASDQSGKATNQIATTMQQVASGTIQQSEEVAKTARSVEHMNRIIDEVSRGAQEQAQAANQASSMAIRISSTIEQVTNAAKAGARGAGEAADAAVNGGQTIQATITGMQTLKSKVGLSAQKVREMGQRSEQIDAIVETIEEIASQTDLLALNAAIEAARVESKSQSTVETILQHHMLGAASLLAQLLEDGHELRPHELEVLAQQAKVQDFFVSDSDGMIIASTNPSSLGFRFSEDPRQQSSVFRSLLNRKDGIVVQPIQAREQDNKPFMFVGVSRRDCQGIIQVGMPADSVYALVGYSRGFAVVADEVRKLSVHAKTATKEIAVLIRNIQKSVVEAVTVMEDAARDVENRSVQATQAGESLASILKTVETVNQQVSEISSAIQHMDVSSRELVSAVEAVNAVVEENTAATEEMAANSGLMRQAMENIASVSEENSAAVEEVSASTEEVLAQVEQVSASAISLMDMAQALQTMVAQFALASNRHDRAK